MHFITNTLRRSPPLNLLRTLFSQNRSLKEFDDRQMTSTVRGIIAQRRKQRQWLNEQQAKQAPIQAIMEHYADNLMELTLYMRHDCERSHLVFALMNYNNLGFKKISNIVFLEEATWLYKDQMRKLKDEERWPMVRAQTALNPVEVLIGQDKIMRFMFENHFFKPVESNASWVEPAIEFIKRDIEKPLNAIFWNPILTAQVCFDGDAKSDRKLGRSTIIFKVIRYNLQKIVASATKNLWKLYRNNEQYKKGRQNFLKGLEQWTKLLNKTDFCGGKQPNMADFYLFSVIKAKWNSRHFRNFIQNKTPKPFLAWFRRMSSLCQFNSQRLTIL